MDVAQFLESLRSGGGRRACHLLVHALACTAAIAGQPRVNGTAIFPPDDIWNTRVDTLPVDPNSTAYVNTIGAATSLHPDFGSTFGIPYIEVPGTQPLVNVSFLYYDESDPGPYPIPLDAPIEGGGLGDSHVIAIDRDNHKLYELFAAHTNVDGTWHADSGAVFDLNSSALRPETWTSCDAAGLPILPGPVRYDEVAAGAVEHAIRFTVPQSRNTYVWPARHKASLLTGMQYPPMGQRFRLKASYDISGFSPRVQVIMTALKKYGIILADNGSSWFITGAPDVRWDDDEVSQLKTIKGSNFEAVVCSSLILNNDSGQVKYPRAGIGQVSVRTNIMSIAITNLFPGVSNVIERTFDLASPSWQTNSGFMCETAATNLSVVVSNSWEKVFYRVKRL